jgi:hypothetical protein
VISSPIQILGLNLKESRKPKTFQIHGLFFQYLASEMIGAHQVTIVINRQKQAAAGIVPLAGVRDISEPSGPRMTAEQCKSRAMFASRTSSSPQLARSYVVIELIVIALSVTRQSLIARLKGLRNRVRSLPAIDQASGFSRFSSRLIAVLSLAIDLAGVLEVHGYLRDNGLLIFRDGICMAGSKRAHQYT